MELTLRIIDFINLTKQGGQYQVKGIDGWKTVGDLYIKNNKQKYQIVLENGKMLVGSEDHLVNIDTYGVSEENLNENLEVLDGAIYLRLKNLTTNDLVVTSDGSSKPTLIKQLEVGTTYDLEVLDDTHSYLTNDIVSHNTGKTSLAEHLAAKIVDKNVSITLQDKKIYSLDISSIVAGTKYRGQFEERMKALINELKNNPDVIIFLDEIHMIIGAGSTSGGMDAANIFKPALSRGEIRVIGATTLDEYKAHIEKDTALDRRFQKVTVSPTNREETIQILNNIKDRYESHHKVTYTPDAIEACVDLMARYLPNRFFPDGAIDALDETGSRVHLDNIVVPNEILEIEERLQQLKEQKEETIRKQLYEDSAKIRDSEKTTLKELDEAKKRWNEHREKNRTVITENDVAKVVSSMSGVPVSKVTVDENKKLADIHELMKGKVIGQDYAVEKICKSIQRGRIGLKDPNKPIGVFLLVGGSGTGKTHLSKQLAKYMFDSEDAIIRMDMSEFMEKISVSRLIGSPPGYVGHGEGGELTEKVRRKPYSVILLDEVEKAHPDVWNIFLQIFDDGHATDAEGRKIDFKNTIIIMTSNIGVRKVREFGGGIGFSKSNNEQKNQNIRLTLDQEIEKTFAPEFINRLDEIIYFNALTKDNVMTIADIEIGKLEARVLSIGYVLKVSERMKQHLVDVGYDENMGARPLKRAIQKWIEDPITEKILEVSPDKNATISVDYNEKTKLTSVSIKNKSKKSNK